MQKQATLTAALFALALQTNPAEAQKPRAPLASRAARIRVPNLNADGRAAKIIALARTFVGGRYVFGGSSPGSGFDCSGLVEYVYGRNGVSLPRTAAEQFSRGRSVRFDELAPGDLIFQAGTYKAGISHVAIYIGDGKILHAKGEKYGIVIDSVGPWKPGAPGARRVIPGLVARSAPPVTVPGAPSPAFAKNDAVAFLDMPAEPVSGSIRLKVGYDPHPVAPGTEYAIEIDGDEVVTFPEAGVYVRFDTTQLDDGQHVLKLVRRNAGARTRFVSDTAVVTVANNGAER